MKITKWIGCCINGNDEADIFFVNHNPGYLAHTFRIEVDVPDEIIECLQRKLPCVSLYKMGPVSKECVRGIESDPDIPTEAALPVRASCPDGAQTGREATTSTHQA